MKKIYHVTNVPLALFADPVAYQKFLQPKAEKRMLKAAKRGKLSGMTIEHTQSKKDKARGTVTVLLIFTY